VPSVLHGETRTNLVWKEREGKYAAAEKPRRNFVRPQPRRNRPPGIPEMHGLAGMGALCVLEGGVLKSYGLDDPARIAKAARGELSFVQDSCNRHRGLAVATRRTQTEGTVAAPPRDGIRFRSSDLCGWLDSFSAASNPRFRASGVLPAAGTPDGTRRCSYGSPRWFPEWCQRS